MADTFTDEAREKEVSKSSGEAKTGTIAGPGLVLAGCPDKSQWVSFEFRVSSFRFRGQGLGIRVRASSDPDRGMLIPET
jgi:hypothetical protein